MSIRNHNGTRTIFCSFCDNSSQSMRGVDFHEAIDVWKDEGWRMFKKDEDPEWKHICPECREDSKAEYARRREDRGGDFD